MLNRLGQAISEALWSNAWNSVLSGQPLLICFLPADIKQHEDSVNITMQSFLMQGNMPHQSPKQQCKFMFRLKTARLYPQRIIFSPCMQTPCFVACVLDPCSLSLTFSNGVNKNCLEDWGLYQGLFRLFSLPCL